MDSLYKALTAPVPVRFSDCVAKYSDDKKPFWVGWLETPEEFEKVAFSLPKGEYFSTLLYASRDTYCESS